MPKNPQINYLNKDFESVREDLIQFVKNFFPDKWQDFNLASPGMAFLELNAYVADLLSFSIDKKFNELFLDSSQERNSIYRLARTHGYNIPGVRPSITVADINIEVPVTAQGPDKNYLPIIRPGMQVRGAGQVFETLNEIDFANDFSEEGVENRKIEPILNQSQDLIRYRITKRERIQAGSTKVFTTQIGPDEATDFLEITLPENNVLSVESVIKTNNIEGEPSFRDFNNNDIRYFEVKELPQDEVFVEDDSQGQTGEVSQGKLMKVDKRFKKEFLPDGKCKLTFGGGEENRDDFENLMRNLTNVTRYSEPEDLDISSFLDNTALGEKIQPNTSLAIKYRVGGGILSNIGSNVLNDVSNVNAKILGPDPQINQSVLQSIRANNPIPAIGGKGLPSVNEIRQNIAHNYAAQDRAVILNDYISKSFQIPGKFGAPFRVQGRVDDNKIKLYVLTRDSSGSLISSSTNIIKSNLVNYLSQFRMMNDFVEINDARVVNLQIETDLFIDGSFNASEVKRNSIQEIRSFFNVEDWHMNDNIYVSQVVDILREVPGVINVVDVRFFQVTGGKYSTTTTEQATGNSTRDPDTGVIRTEVNLEDFGNTIFGTPFSMFEVKFPDKDIKVRIS